MTTDKPNLRPYLGQQVTVRVDRPLGSRHPRWGFAYPVNYGELPGTLSGDGRAIDAYLLGWDEPLAEVIAVLERADDREDKLVVARTGSSWSDRQILEAVEFQERHFRTVLVRARRL